MMPRWKPMGMTPYPTTLNLILYDNFDRESLNYGKSDFRE